MSLDVGVFKTELDANGQSHLYQFWNDLSDQDKANLFNELRNLNVDRINEAYTVSVFSPLVFFYSRKPLR